MTEAERIRRAHVYELSHAADGVAEANATLKRAIEQARQDRLSWDLIGPAVGMTRQGARQRWGLI